MSGDPMIRALHDQMVDQMRSALHSYTSAPAHSGAGAVTHQEAWCFVQGFAMGQFTALMLQLMRSDHRDDVNRSLESALATMKEEIERKFPEQ